KVITGEDLKNCATLNDLHKLLG
ncbi:acyl carrier protein, partial [Xanthomonas perforans]|nr:acyl carrier protein [Xanthomonas perforans]